jgi:hypothetical protein
MVVADFLKFFLIPKDFGPRKGENNGRKLLVKEAGNDISNNPSWMFKNLPIISGDGSAARLVHLSVK